jgi:hypothetical protein
MARSLRLIDNESGIVEITSRTLHGRFLMRPSAESKELILGVLGRAQAKYKVEIYAFIFLSNHFHILMRVDSARQMALFVGYLKANIAKELGRLHGWKEKFWGRRYHSASLADSDQAVSARFMYVLSNGCKEGLIGSPCDWPGPSSASALFHGESTLRGTWYDRTAENQARLRGEVKEFPSAETVRLSPLPFLAASSKAARQAFFVDAVRRVEQQTRDLHRVSLTEPLGVHEILSQDPHRSATRFIPSPAPLFHATTQEEFRAMYSVREVREAAYRAAAARLRSGEDNVRFPPGCFPPPQPYVEMRGPP